MENQQTPGLLLCDDLIFISRIAGTGRDLGLAIKSSPSADALLALAGEQNPPCVIVDLSAPGLVIADLMRRLKETCSPVPLVVAFGPHVDAAGLRTARAAGCDIVWPRSKFAEELPRALPLWFSHPVGD